MTNLPTPKAAPILKMADHLAEVFLHYRIGMNLSEQLFPISTHSIERIGGLVVAPSFFGQGWDVIHWAGFPTADSLEEKENAITLATQLHNYFEWHLDHVHVQHQIRCNNAARQSMINLIKAYNGRYTASHSEAPTFPQSDDYLSN